MGHMKFKQTKETTTINILFVARSEQLKINFMHSYSVLLKLIASIRCSDFDNKYTER